MSNKQVFQSLTGLLICLSGCMTIYAFVFSPLNIDGGFYLHLSEFISKNPNDIIMIGYTPVAISIWTLLYYLFPNISYEPALLLSVFILLINSFALTKILSLIKNFKTYELQFIFWLYMLLQFTMDGTSIILEPLTMMFCLASVYLILKNKNLTYVIAAGAMCSLSFMTKHYGAASLGVIVFVIFKNQNSKVNLNFIYQSLLLLLSFLVITVFIYVTNVYFLFSKVVSPELIFQTSLSYGNQSISTGMFNFTKGLFQFLPILLTPILFFKNIMRLKGLQLGLIGVLAFLPAFYFKQYHHYYLLILPFVLLAFAITTFSIFNSTKEKLKVIISILIIILTVASNIRTMVLSEQISKQEQRDISSKIAKLIPQNSTVFISNSRLQPYRFLNKLNGPLMTEYGLGFPSNYSTEIQNKMIKNSDYLLYSEKYRGGRAKLIGIINKSIYVYKNV